MPCRNGLQIVQYTKNKKDLYITQSLDTTTKNNTLHLASGLLFMQRPRKRLHKILHVRANSDTKPNVSPACVPTRFAHHAEERKISLCLVRCAAFSDAKRYTLMCISKTLINIHLFIHKHEHACVKYCSMHIAATAAKRQNREEPNTLNAIHICIKPRTQHTTRPDRCARPSHSPSLLRAVDVAGVIYCHESRPLSAPMNTHASCMHMA